MMAGPQAGHDDAGRESSITTVLDRHAHMIFRLEIDMTLSDIFSRHLITHGNQYEFSLTLT